MNELPGKEPDLLSAIATISLPNGFNATWAGALTAGRVFCLGSEDGKVLFTNDQGKPLFGPVRVSPSGEAINGAAISAMWLAVSTRDDVTFLPMRPGDNGRKDAIAFPHGAHGIAVTPIGAFIAPLGRSGILVVSPPLTADTAMTIRRDDMDAFYNYRVGCIWTASNREILISATRMGGSGHLANSRDRKTAMS